jgi:hypothetical protein
LWGKCFVMVFFFGEGIWNPTGLSVEEMGYIPKEIRQSINFGHHLLGKQNFLDII